MQRRRARRWAARRRLRGVRLALETLEDRRLLTAFIPAGGPFNAGTNPTALVTSDFNGDGFSDIAVVNSSAGQVNVLLNDGSGGFLPAVSYSVGGTPTALAAGDFNGDGFPDLAVTKSNGTVEILLNNGPSSPGTFSAGATYTVGSNPLSVAVGDFNGDGVPDLVTANFGNNTLSVLLGNGDGTFQAPLTIAPAGGSPYAVTTGDFNGDGFSDIAVTNEDNNPGTVSVFLSNGDGTFQAPATYAVGQGPESIAVGDFNGDRVPDLVTVNEDAFSNANTVSVLLGIPDALGNPTGTFGTAITSTAGGAGSEPSSVAVGDFNGNGLTDMVVANATPSSTNPARHTVSVLYSNGDGTFTASDTYNVGPTPSAVAVGDFNRDGRLDFAAANSGSNTVSLLDNDPSAIRFSLSAVPNVADPGDPITLTLSALNSSGNPATGYTGTVHFSSSDPMAVLPLDHTFGQADNGVHTFSGVQLFTPGPQTITATDTSRPVITATTSVSVNVAAGSFVISGLPATVQAGVPFSSFTVTVYKTDSVTVNTGYRGTITFAGSDPYPAVLPANYTFAAADAGQHTFSLPNQATFFTAGRQTLTVSAVADNVIPGSGAVLVTPAPASSLYISDSPSTTAGVPLDLAVYALDPYRNVDTNYRGTIAFTSSDPYPATLPANYTFQSSDNGVATFPGGAILYSAGMRSITATDTVQRSITGTYSGIQVNPAAASTLLVAGFPSPTTVAVDQNFTVSARDAYGNTATNYAGTVGFSSSDSQAALPAPYQFTSADAGLHKFAATLNSAGIQDLVATDRAAPAITGTQSDIQVDQAGTTPVGAGPAAPSGGSGGAGTIVVPGPATTGSGMNLSALASGVVPLGFASQSVAGADATFSAWESQNTRQAGAFTGDAGSAAPQSLAGASSRRATFASGVGSPEEEALTPASGTATGKEDARPAARLVTPSSTASGPRDSRDAAASDQGSAPGPVQSAPSATPAHGLKPLQMDLLRQELDALAKGSEAWFSGEDAARAAVVSLLLSVGYIVLYSRNSYLLLSALTATSLWRELDPLTILELWEKESNHRKRRGEDALNDEKVESLFEGSASRSAHRR